MTGIELKEIVIDQNKKREFGKIVDRDIMNKYDDFHKNPFVVIISGVRRCGKSTLLKQIMNGNPGYYLNFDDDRLINFLVDDFQKLTEVFHELYGEKQYYYLDEIQNIKGWELFARRLRDEEKKLYVTGSNATMLSKELGTRLTGRYLQITLYPFSFHEFIKYKKVPVHKLDNFTTEEKSRLKAAFSQYITLGGFPEYLLTENVEYLRTLYNNIIYRDVLARYNITNDKSVKELMYQIASNTAKEFSYNSLKNTLKLGSSTTIKDYISYIENSYLLVQIPKFSYSTKSQIYANKKIYMIDTAMAILNGFRISGDMGRLFENIVCIQLKRKNHELFYFRNRFECDFIAQKNNSYQAIQVCYDLNDSNRTREINGLVEAMDKLNLKKGEIITIDQEEALVQDNKQIKIVPAYKWFLN
jgi:predicted AAA+ superfamily ATPase